MSVELMSHCNRTGSDGKRKFHLRIEDLVREVISDVHPNIKSKDFHQNVARVLKNASDCIMKRRGSEQDLKRRPRHQMKSM